MALGSECPGGVGPGDETAGPGQIQSGLLWSYLGHGARELDPTHDAIKTSPEPCVYRVPVKSIRGCQSDGAGLSQLGE